MKNTTNYKLKKPEGTDVVNVDDFNSNADIIDGKLKELETNEIFYAVATGSANTYAVSISALSTLSTYFDGLAVCVKINTLSTGASTLNVNGWGAKAIVDSLGNPITNGGLKANTPYTLRYNGVNFILQGKGGGGNVTADKLLNGSTATGDSGAVVGTMPDNGAINITPGATAQTIPLGYTSGGTVAGDPNLISNYILGSKSIFGIQGKVANVDTSDALATASQLLSGASAYVNGLKVLGSIQSRSATTYNPSTTAQTIPQGLYLAGVQTIAPVTGTSNVGHVLAGYTFSSANGINLTGNIPSKGATTITPGTTDQVVSANQYLSGAITVLGDPDLIGSNIVNTANLFGIQGTAPKIDTRYARNGYQYWSNSVMPVNPYIQAQIVYCNGKIYCFFPVLVSGSTYKNSLQIYDINSDTWTAGADLNTSNGLRGMNIEVYNNKIYLIGGYQIYSTASFNTGIICYDIATNTYSTIAYMPTSLYSPMATIYNGKIYIYSGRLGSSGASFNTSSTLIYDIASNTWSTGAGYPQSQTSEYGAVGGYNGILYTLGGNTAYAYTYNIASNTWATWNIYSTFAERGNLIQYNGALYLFMLNSSAVRYNLSSSSWVRFEDTRGSYGGSSNWTFVDGRVYMLDVPKYGTNATSTARTCMRIYEIYS